MNRARSSFLYPLAAGALLAYGCGGKDGTNGTNGTNGANGSLVRTSAVAAGNASCPTGGTRIDVGFDDGTGGGTAGNGTLEDGEVRSTSYVCNPSAALVKSSTLAIGDSQCPGGGVRTDSGIDDGAGGGTANDGVLEAGEITSTTYVCNDQTSHVGSFDPPAGGEGTYFINTRGGKSTATNSSGGNGGRVEIYTDYGSAGGHVKLFKTGRVDASFTWPSTPASFDYGTTPLEVASGTTVHVKPVTALSSTTDVAGGALVDGDVVTLNCAWTMPYIWHSASLADEVTGIHIQPSATLQFDHYDASCVSRYVQVYAAIVNEGTIKGGQSSAGNVDTLYLYGGSFYGADGSMIDMRGKSQGVGVAGGSGGYLQLMANMGDNAWGAVWNRGTIDTSGGDGDNGGSAGGMYLWANSSFYNSGNLLAKGGNAVTLDPGVSATYGGNGNSIDFEAGYGGMYNSGNVDTSGGDGSTGGGDAAYIDIYGGDQGVGDLYNTGTLAAHGGDADSRCNTTSCYGGSGNSVYLYAYGGNLYSSADVSSYGGNGRAGTGGNGSYIYAYAYSGYNYNTVDYNNIPGGAISISGNWDAHGGDGANGGGSGGPVYAEADPDYVPMGQELAFLGYGGGIDTSGGDGWLYGGYAGYTYISQGYCAENNGACAWPAGSVINYVDVKSRGGNASAVGGSGGNGGYAQWYTYYASYAVGSYGYEKLINRGNLDVSGGSGGAYGGNAGWVFWYGLDGLDNEGTIVANGGDATASGGYGGGCNAYSWYNDSYGIQLLADRGPVANKGALSNDGGNASFASGGGVGGGSGGIHLEGPTVENSAAVSADGGDANTTAGWGGSGYNVVLQSVNGITSNIGTLSATGGAGATNQVGSNGYVVIDGQME